jgi:hypothetical protein
MSFKSHAVIKVSPRGRNTGTSVSQTNFVYQLSQPVHFKARQNPLKSYFVRIENAKIPITFYNINSNYNTFGWTGSTTGVVSFDITQGNYTIDELIAEIQTQMNALDLNTYTVSYNEITQKVSIASTGTENLSTLTGDGWQIIGFDLSETITGAATATGTNVAYTNTMGWLKLVVDNINTSNYYENDENATTQTQKVMLDIPIKSVRNEYEFYDNHQGAMFKLPSISSIIELRVRLLDKYNNIVDLNNVPWSFDIVFYEHTKNQVKVFTTPQK